MTVPLLCVFVGFVAEQCTYVLFDVIYNIYVVVSCLFYLLVICLFMVYLLSVLQFYDRVVLCFVVVSC